VESPNGCGYRSRMAAQQFQVLFCQQFDCPPSEYEKRAFRALLYLHARPVAWMIRILSRGFFEEDLKFIRDLGEAEDFREAAETVADFRDKNSGWRGFWRKRLKLRVSGRKAAQLARQLFFRGMT
jgi:hypothetical protein